MFLPVRGVPGGKAASASRRERTHCPHGASHQGNGREILQALDLQVLAKGRGQAHGGTKARSRVFPPQCLSLPVMLSPCCLMLL